MIFFSSHNATSKSNNVLTDALVATELELFKNGESLTLAILSVGIEPRLIRDPSILLIIPATAGALVL